jgi:hypothetical protein
VLDVELVHTVKPGEVSPSDFLNLEEDVEAMGAQPVSEEGQEGGPEGHPDCQLGGSQRGELTEEQEVELGEPEDEPAFPGVMESPEDQEGQPTEDEPAVPGVMESPEDQEVQQMEDEPLPGTTGGPGLVVRI